MKTEMRGGFPPMVFAGETLHAGIPPRPVVVLSRQERATLERAARILERVRDAMDPHGREEWTPEYEVAACAETWVREAASLDYGVDA